VASPTLAVVEQTLESCRVRTSLRLIQYLPSFVVLARSAEVIVVGARVAKFPEYNFEVEVETFCKISGWVVGRRCGSSGKVIYKLCGMFKKYFEISGRAVVVVWSPLVNHGKAYS
jgi:hypothetical protein